MKIIKIAGVVLATIIIGLLVAALFVSNDFHYEQSITINKPINQVWENTNSLADLAEWSPCADYDPNIKVEFAGIDGTVGAKTTWESPNKKVGKGSQTITKIDAPKLFLTDLKFYTPYESEAEGFVKLTPEGENTIVTWGFDSEMPYPFNLMKLTMNIDEAIGKNFKVGLNKLKVLCEK